MAWEDLFKTKDECGTDDYTYKPADMVTFKINWDDCSVKANIERTEVISKPEEDYFKAELKTVFCGSIEKIKPNDINEMLRNIDNATKFKDLKILVQQALQSNTIKDYYKEYYSDYKHLIDVSFENIEKILEPDVQLILEVINGEE